MVLVALVVLPAFTRVREYPTPMSCQTNLKHMGLVFKMYSNESAGEYYPPIHVAREIPVYCDQALRPKAGEPVDVMMLMPNLPSIWPEFFNDIRVIHCPAIDRDVTGFDVFYDDFPRIPLCQDAQYGLAVYDDSYLYFGWVFDQLGPDAPQEHLAHDAGAGPAPKQWTSVLRGLEAAPDPSYYALSDLKLVPPLNNAGHDRLYRLREGVQAHFAQDPSNPLELAEAEDRIPVMMDRLRINDAGVWTKHEDAIAYVMYLDGHVEARQLDRHTPAHSGIARGLTLLPSI